VTSVLTPKGEATRSRIVAGAAAEIRANGINTTTLDDIRARTQTSKSQLFHYFPEGKEQLLLAVAAHEADRVLQDQQPHLSRLTTWSAWTDWRNAVVARYRQQGRSCPLSVLMTELGRSTPAARQITVALIEQWQREIVDGIRAMQRSGRVSPDLDPDDVGRALLAGIQGGVSIMLATGDSAHLESALDVGIAGLRRR
jgi:AcrR family transcriptional regulator